MILAIIGRKKFDEVCTISYSWLSCGDPPQSN